MSEISDVNPTSASGDIYTLWAIYRKPDPVGSSAPLPDDAAPELDATLTELEAAGVTTRGLYDVSGMRADADIMIWLYGTDPAALQAALRTVQRTSMFAGLLRTWSAMGVHRDAEFNKAHVPGFIRGIEARTWLTVYPFIRSYDWYLLPDDERRAMLADHGRKGAQFKSVVANTVSAFALGDYEWILPMESDNLTDLVDMMRSLRYTEARRHVREEVPFFTGRRVSAESLVEVLQ